MATKKKPNKKTPAPASMKRPKKATPKPAGEMAVTKAIDEMMSRINDHEFATSSVHWRDTIAFYEGIIAHCRDNAEIIKGEHLDEDDDE